MIYTLGRYFFRRYMALTLWFFVGVTAITYLIDFGETTSRFADVENFTIGMALVMTALRLPLILQQTVPFVALFVGITALIALNRKSEIVVTRAAGISVWQFMMPFLLGAFLIGLATTFAINPLAAWAQRQSIAVESTFKEARNNSSRSSVVPWLRQISGGTDVIIGARNILDEGSLLIDAVLIHFDSEGRITLRQDARSAKLEDGYWQLNDITETRPGEVPTRLATARVSTNLKQEFIQERLAQPETVGFYELSRKIEVARSYGVSSKPLETQFHSLLSLPFLLVAMTLIAATVSLKFSRFNQSRSVILGGILSGFVLYVVTVLVKAFGSSGVVPPFVAAWLPVVVAMSLGATILLHQEDG